MRRPRASGVSARRHVRVVEPRGPRARNASRQAAKLTVTVSLQEVKSGKPPLMVGRSRDLEHEQKLSTSEAAASVGRERAPTCACS